MSCASAHSTGDGALAASGTLVSTWLIDGATASTPGTGMSIARADAGALQSARIAQGSLEAALAGAACIGQSSPADVCIGHTVDSAAAAVWPWQSAGAPAVATWWAAQQSVGTSAASDSVWHRSQRTVQARRRWRRDSITEKVPLL